MSQSPFSQSTKSRSQLSSLQSPFDLPSSALLPSQSLLPSTSSSPLQSKMIQKLVCILFLFCFCFACLFFFFTLRILILYNYNCYFSYLRRLNMFLDFAEWISPTPVPCRYFILLISTCSYATDAPVSVFWMFERNPKIWIFITRVIIYMKKLLSSDWLR